MEILLEDEVDEIDVWLAKTKNELTTNIDTVMTTSLVDRETLEIMKNLIQTIKITPKEIY